MGGPVNNDAEVDRGFLDALLFCGRCPRRVRHRSRGVRKPTGPRHDPVKALRNKNQPKPVTWTVGNTQTSHGTSDLSGSRRSKPDTRPGRAGTQTAAVTGSR